MGQREKTCEREDRCRRRENTSKEQVCETCEYRVMFHSGTRGERKKKKRKKKRRERMRKAEGRKNETLEEREREKRGKKEAAETC